MSTPIPPPPPPDDVVIPPPPPPAPDEGPKPPSLSTDAAAPKAGPPPLPPRPDKDEVAKKLKEASEKAPPSLSVTQEGPAATLKSAAPKPKPGAEKKKDDEEEKKPEEKKKKDSDDEKPEPLSWSKVFKQIADIGRQVSGVANIVVHPVDSIKKIGAEFSRSGQEMKQGAEKVKNFFSSGSKLEGKPGKPAPSTGGADDSTPSSSAATPDTPEPSKPGSDLGEQFSANATELAKLHTNDPPNSPEPPALAEIPLAAAGDSNNPSLKNKAPEPTPLEKASADRKSALAAKLGGDDMDPSAIPKPKPK